MKGWKSERLKGQKGKRAKENMLPTIMLKKGVRAIRIFLWLTGRVFFSEVVDFVSEVLTALSSTSGFARDGLNLYCPYGGLG